MRSPGRPDPSRVVQRQFWWLIATGVTTVDASVAVGVSWPVGARWFRHAGGMPPISLAEVEFPDDESMRISHEAIYQSLFIEGRGALKRELVTCLRTGRALRAPRERSRNKAQGHVTVDVVLSERPAEADDRAVPGYWEGDLIIGTGRSAIGTLVERSSRSTLLVHLPRMARSRM